MVYVCCTVCFFVYYWFLVSFFVGEAVVLLALNTVGGFFVCLGYV